MDVMSLPVLFLLSQRGKASELDAPDNPAFLRDDQMRRCLQIGGPFRVRVACGAALVVIANALVAPQMYDLVERADIAHIETDRRAEVLQLNRHRETIEYFDELRHAARADRVDAMVDEGFAATHDSVLYTVSDCRFFCAFVALSAIPARRRPVM